jgi:hypothetical protein
LPPSKKRVHACPQSASKKDEQLLRDASTTFALSNQWGGPDVLPAIDQIAARFPELEISYEVADA